MTDDQGYGDLGCYGSPNIKTPNIDRMAAEGMLFTNFYAAPFCAPSRAQLLTGSYPPRVGMARNPFPDADYELNPNEITIAEILKEEGYATMCIGKWHLGDAPKFLPVKQGFDTFFGIPYSNDMWHYHPRREPQPDEDSLMRVIRKRAEYTGFAGQGNYLPANQWLKNDLPLMKDENVIEHNPDQRKFTTMFTKAAIDFIDKQHQNPFFLYLSHPMPHVPLFVSKKFTNKSTRGLYGDVVTEIDWSVGQIMDRLRELGIDNRTLLVFLSDNGPWLEYGIDGGSAGPLREGKGSRYEGGFRVPAVFRWPGKIAPGARTTTMAANLDLLPTIAAIAGTEPPSDRIIDGKNLLPVLIGQTNQSPHSYFHYFGGSAEGKINYLAIRDQKWKLVITVTPEGKIESRELYNLNEDVSERFNRISLFPDIAEKLNTAATKFHIEMKQNLRPAGHQNNHL